MADSTPRFCTTCGAPFDDASRFCRSCGTPRQGAEQAATPAVTQAVTQAPTQAPASSVVAGGPAQQGRPAMTSVQGAMRTAQMAATYGGMAAALPWQTVVAGQRPDLGAFLRQAGAPVTTMVAQTVVRRSVRKPAFALLFTTLVDALVTVISGQPAALSALGMRVLMGSGTGFLGLLVGKRGGFGRGLVGVGSAATSVLQLYNAGSMLLAAIQAQSGFLTLLPSLVSTISVIVIAVKTVLVSFRKPRS